MKETTLHKQQLADFLETVPDSHIKMDSWYSGFNSIANNPQKDPREFLNHCGTSACIAGWATYLWPKFAAGVDESVPGDEHCVKVGALDVYLGLTPLQSLVLFAAEGTRKSQIALLRKWVAEETPDTVVVFAIVPRDRALVTQGESHAN